MKNDVRCEYVPQKMSDFTSILLFWFTLVVKLRKLGFENHCNTLVFLYIDIFYNKTRYGARIEYLH